MDLKQFIKTSGNEYASIVEEGVAAGDVNNYIDTGSYLFNALLSGSLRGGLPSNKITAIAGESATGKTYFALGVVKQFLESNPDGGVLYFESESAIPKELIESRGIDSSRMVILPVVTIQEFRTQTIKILDAYLEEGEQKPMMIVLDSLGNLSTTKELEDTATGAETRDMTRAQIIKAAFRVLTLKLGRANVPLIVTNHTYAVIGAYMPTKEMGGGCLVDGTNIQMADGSLKNISEVKEGDFVNTMGGSHPVLQTHEFDDKELYEIEFEDGYKVKCSAAHKFLVDDEWVTAEDIFSNNISEVGKERERIMKIVSIKKTTTEKVYDITVDQAEHYILGNGVITHNSGLKYAASSIIYLSKKKDKDGTEVIGNIIHCKNQKSRLTIENKMIDVKLGYQSGIDRYYGLLEFGEKYDVFKKSGNRYTIDDKQMYASAVYKDPEKYFNEDIMKQLETAAKKEFLYGEVHQDVSEETTEK